jgi:copper chaperone CopZ
VIVLALAWYQKLKPKKEIDCNCEEEKPKFVQSKLFLGFVTGFAAIMLTFPYYSNIFLPDQDIQTVEYELSNIQVVEISIEGMTCNSCEQHVDHEVSKLNGVVRSDASFKNGNAIVRYDDSMIELSEIHEAINGTGYNVTEN